MGTESVNRHQQDHLLVFLDLEQVVYRGPVVWRSQASHYESMIAAMKVIVQHERTLDKPLEHLGFLGSVREKMNVLDQGVEKVAEQGRIWLDYRLTVNDIRSSQTLKMLFRVDAATKLPQLCRMEGQWDGKPMIVETRFDYPEKGPADIYDLGVPKTTKLVDRTPTGDLDHILKTLQAGRERMDNYRAVFVQHLEGIDYKWWADLPCIFYRKGNRFRADSVGGGMGNLSAVKRPALGEDLGKWWRERTKSFRFYTQYLLRDSTLYSSDIKTVKDPDGSQHLDIISVQKTEFNIIKPGELVPPEYSMRPEFACRPPMGLGNPDLEPVIDLHPTEGPPGCILLSIRHTSTRNRINEKGIGSPDTYRYWLDPQRDYIVMRCEMIKRDETGQEIVIEDDLTEETARSPQGVWYATKIRRKTPSSRDAHGKPVDQVYHLYVDFDVELPDSLFEPPRPGRIH